MREVGHSFREVGRTLREVLAGPGHGFREVGRTFREIDLALREQRSLTPDGLQFILGCTERQRLDLDPERRDGGSEVDADIGQWERLDGPQELLGGHLEVLGGPVTVALVVDYFAAKDRGRVGILQKVAVALAVSGGEQKMPCQTAFPVGQRPEPSLEQVDALGVVHLLLGITDQLAEAQDLADSQGNRHLRGLQVAELSLPGLFLPFPVEVLGDVLEDPDLPDALAGDRALMAPGEGEETRMGQLVPGALGRLGVRPFKPGDEFLGLPLGVDSQDRLVQPKEVVLQGLVVLDRQFVDGPLEQALEIGGVDAGVESELGQGPHAAVDVSAAITHLAHCLVDEFRVGADRLGPRLVLGNAGRCQCRKRCAKEPGRRRHGMGLDLGTHRQGPNAPGRRDASQPQFGRVLGVFLLIPRLLDDLRGDQHAESQLPDILPPWVGVRRCGLPIQWGEFRVSHQATLD